MLNRSSREPPPERNHKNRGKKRYGDPHTGTRRSKASHPHQIYEKPSKENINRVNEAKMAKHQPTDRMALQNLSQAAPVMRTFFVGPGFASFSSGRRIKASSATLTPRCSSGRFLTQVYHAAETTAPSTPQITNDIRQPQCFATQLINTGPIVAVTPTPARNMLVPNARSFCPSQ